MDFIPLSSNPNDLAQLEADKLRYQQRQQLAQSLMGAQYVPNSGGMGVLTSALSSLAGAFVNRRNNESLTDLMRREFETQNKAAMAKRQQEQADEERKFNRELQKIGYGEKAKRDYAAPEFKDGGIFDPTTGSYTPSQAWTQQQLALKKAEAAIVAANRAPTADPFAKAKAALAAGMITPDQYKQAVQHELMGGSGTQAPSGYRQKPDGSLEFIPGGPADPNAQKTKPIPADMAGKVALADEYAQNFPNIEKQVAAGELTGPFDSSLAQAGYGKRGEVYRQIQSGQDALQRTLTGAGMPASEASLYAARYLPQATDTAETLLSKQRQLKKELENFTNIARGNSAAPDAPQGQAPGGETKTINGQTFVKVGDQWFHQ